MRCYFPTAIATAVVLFVTLPSSDGMAGIPRPYTWAKVTPDGNSIVVMRVDDAATSPIASLSLEDVSTSGLFSAKPPHEMIWAFQPRTWFAETQMMSASGTYIVAPGGWALSTTDQLSTAATVYRNGRPLHVIAVNEVVSLLRLKSLLSAGPIECVEYGFDPRALTLTFVTNRGESTILDITSGKIVHHDDPLAVVILIAIVTCLLVVSVVICRRCLTRRKARAARTH